MSKQYKVRSHKRREHIFNHVENVSQFCQSLETWGDKTLYVWKEQGEKKTLTYTEFTAMIYRVADGLLRTCGSFDPALTDRLNENVRIGILGETSPYWVASYLGILLAGGVAIPMDKELDPAVTGEFLDSVDAMALIHSGTFNDTFRDLPASHASVKFTVSFAPADDAPETCRSFASLLAAGEEAGKYVMYIVASCDRDSPIQYTINGASGKGYFARNNYQSYDKIDIAVVNVVKGTNTLTVTITENKNHNFWVDCYYLVPVTDAG